MSPRAWIHPRLKWAAALLAALFCAALLAFWRSPAGAPAPLPARPALDLTFLVASDTHLGLDAIESRNLAMIERMNSLAGTPFPGAIGGKVGVPSAALVTGDLTENGGASQWRLFTQFYGRNGQDGRLRYPVFETSGNHDHAADSFVLDRIRERHGDACYAFDLGGVHFVGLAEAPDEQGLSFLARDLAAHPADTPTVLFFHLPLQGPWAEHNWFTQGGFRERLQSVLQGHRILAIFHGHSHFSSAYRWNGIDVYNPGSVKHSQRAFLVVNIRDDAMTVAAWNLDFGSWWWWHQKPLDPMTSRVHETVGIQAPPDFKIRPNLLLQPQPEPNPAGKK